MPSQNLNVCLGGGQLDLVVYASEVEGHIPKIWIRLARNVTAALHNTGLRGVLMFIGASKLRGEVESGATAAQFGPVGSVVFGGFGTVLIAAGWFNLLPALAKRDQMELTVAA